MNLTTKILFLFANFCTIFSPIQGKLILGIWIAVISYYYLFFIESKKFKTKYNTCHPQYYKQCTKNSEKELIDPYFIVSYSRYFPVSFAYHLLFYFLYCESILKIF